MVIKKIMNQDIEINNLHLIHKQITVSNLKTFNGVILDALLHATEILTFISENGKVISLHELQSLDSFIFENKEFCIHKDEESEQLILQIIDKSINTQNQMNDFGIN